MTRTASPPVARLARLVRRAALVVPLGAVAVAPSAARAQPTVVGDAETAAFVSVLRADVARSATRARAGATIGREIEAEIAAIGVKASADPLPYVTARSVHLVVPPGARYDAACSREASDNMLAPRLIYVIGDAVDAARRFYRAHGFERTAGEASYEILKWKGGREDPIVVAVYYGNLATHLGPSCARLGKTSLVALHVTDDRPPSAAKAAATASLGDADADVERALARSGMTRDRYQAVLDAAWQARRELQDPEEARQTDALTRLPSADMRAMGDARQKNRAWLARHRADVVPALDAYAQAMGGQ